MKPHDLVAIFILIICSLSKQSVKGDVPAEQHLNGKSEAGASPSLKSKLKAVVQDKLGSNNSEALVYQRDPQQLVLEEDEIKITRRTGDHLDGLNELIPNGTTWKDFPCPDAASIAPCVCSFDAEFNIDLNCTYVESEEQLAAVFQQEFPTKELHGFYMSTNDKLKVIGNILNGVSFQRIYLGLGPFTFELISEYFILDNKESLTSLEIMGSKMITEAFPFAILDEMKKLLYFHLHHNDLIKWIPKITAPVVTLIDIDGGPIDSIETGTFPVRADGMEVQVEGNYIATIEPGSFYFVDEDSAASNGYLRINLSFNKLQSLDAGVYLLRNGAMQLVLDHNQISSIELGTFVLPQATNYFSVEFNFAANLLETIDEDIFGELFPFVTKFIIKDNPLLCGCDIAWIVLNSTYMTKIDAEATCANGQNLHTLDPAAYNSVC